MNQTLKNLFLGKDYEARQQEFADRLRAELAAEESAMFNGRTVLRHGDTVTINGTTTEGVVQAVTKETDGSVFARVQVATGAPVMTVPAQPVVKAAAVVVAQAYTPVKVSDNKIIAVLDNAANAVANAFGNAADAVARGAVAVADRVAEGGRNLADGIQKIAAQLPGEEAKFNYHFINVDQLTKVVPVAAVAAAPAPVAP